jgi:hypothetical protein
MSHASWRRRIAASLAAIVTLLSIAPPATYAQGSSSADPSEVSEKDLDSFAKSYVELAELRRSYAKRLEGAKGTEASELQSEAFAKTTEILDREGLSADEYNQILVAVNSNERLRKAALERIEEKR